ncbi:MliC family protein [Leptospira sp. WS4.C2]
MKTYNHLKIISIFIITITTAICLISLYCIPAYENIEVVYQAENGQKITAVYHNPTNDEGIYSVTVKIPNHQPITLNQGIAASGIRYTDDKTLVWWAKGGEAFIMKPDGKGDWDITDKYKEILFNQNH